MFHKILLLSAFFCLLTNLSAQSKRGEKLLEERDYAGAMAAFQVETTDPIENARQRLGQAKVYASTRYEDFDPLKAYVIAHELMAERQSLPKNEQEKLDKKLPFSEMRRVALGVESRQLRELKKQNDPAAYDAFLENYVHLSERKVKDAVAARNELAWASIQGHDDYVENQLMVEKYDLYGNLPNKAELQDTLLNRFLRQKSWQEYERFAQQNPKAPYVINALKEKADGFLGHDDLAGAMQFVRANNNNAFGFLLYEGLPNIAKRSSQPTAIKDWLVTFRQDKADWPEVYGHYLDVLLEEGASIAVYEMELKLGRGKLPAADFEEIVRNNRRNLKQLLLTTTDREELKRLIPLADPDLVDEELQSHLLAIYQEQAGLEIGSKAFLERYGKSILGDKAEMDFNAAVAEREAKEEAERQAEAERKAAEEKKEQEQLAARERERAEKLLADKDRTGRHYPSHAAWRVAQRKRVAAGKQPEPYLLPLTVNSEEMEFKANETADGRHLYFTRNHSNENEDIYFSKKDVDGEWGVAEPIEGFSSRLFNESIQLVSTDGTQMLYFNGGKFYNANKTADGWSKGTMISESINQEEWQADAWLSADNRSFFFIRKNYIGTQMYISRKDEKGKWSKAVKLPDNLNKPGQNRSPILAGDLRTLYFTSNAHGGEGQSDIFYSERLDETYLKWSDPVNLGSWINTENDEWMIRLTPDGERFYYSSNYDGSGDVFEIFLPKKVRPKAVVIIEGNVETRDGDGVGTVIVWQDLETGEIIQETRSDPADGSWVATIPGYESGRVGYRISQEGYYSTSGFIEIDGQQKKIVLDQPLKIFTPAELKEDQVVLPLQNLFFATGKYELEAPSYPELDELASLLLAEDLCIEISGHTDNVGASADNQLLSENRAKAVQAYLLSKGISSECLRVKGYGDTRPLTSNATANGRARNRRVEVRFR